MKPVRNLDGSIVLDFDRAVGIRVKTHCPCGCSGAASVDVITVGGPVMFDMFDFPGDPRRGGANEMAKARGLELEALL